MSTFYRCLSLLTAGVLLLCPRIFAAPPDARVYTGVVTVSSDPEGRLLIVGDVPPLDSADVVVIYQSSAPISFPSRTFRRASLLIEPGRVRVVTSRKPPLYLDVAIAEEPIPIEQTPERLILRGGLALTVESVPPETTIAAAMARAGATRILEEEAESSSLAERCLAGGPGSTSCSYKCSSAVGGATLNLERASECSADCLALLSYACCGCDRWARQASCLCIRAPLDNVLPKCHSDLGD